MSVHYTLFLVTLLHIQNVRHFSAVSDQFEVELIQLPIGSPVAAIGDFFSERKLLTEASLSVWAAIRSGLLSITQQPSSRELKLINSHCQIGIKREPKGSLKDAQRKPSKQNLKGGILFVQNNERILIGIDNKPNRVL